MVQVTCSGGIAKAEDAKLKWRRNSPEARPNGKGEWRSWTKERELGVWENTKAKPTMGPQSSSRLVVGANVANDPVDTMSSDRLRRGRQEKATWASSMQSQRSGQGEKYKAKKPWHTGRSCKHGKRKLGIVCVDGRFGSVLRLAGDGVPARGATHCVGA